MKRVFVSGPLHRRYRQDRDINKLSLVSRRVLLCGHVPICPALMYSSFFNDPRFSKNLGWYTGLVEQFMDMCDILCFVYEPLGSKSELSRCEQELWYRKGKGVPVPEDMITEFLINVEKSHG